MSEELITQEDRGVVSPSSFSPQTMEAVKRTIFSGATNEQLLLFVHKCVTAGVHPLDGLIHPMVIDGKVVFVSSIDYFRSAAEDTGEYDGQDPPEFSGECEIPVPNGTITVPEQATVNVYRKGFSRPFVGIAIWSEFFPSMEKKQFMWKKMPKVMLAKCAEGQAFRRAFPKKLNKFYAEEEMHQAECVQKTSTKPAVSMPTPRQQIPATSEPQPAGLAPVEVISDAQAKRLYALCKKAAVNPDAVKNWLKTKLATDGFHAIPKNRYESICARVEKDPEAFKPFEPATQPAGPTNDDFVALAVEIARENGFDRDEMNQQLFDHFQIGDIRDIPEAKQSTVIDFLNALKETAGA